MEDDFYVSSAKSPELDLWLDSHIVLDKRFVLEAQKFGIKIGTKMFWVYQQLRRYEVYGKYGFCVAGNEKLGEDCGLKKKQVVDCLSELVKKGAIEHIYCDSRFYRNKTTLFVSSVLLEEKGLSNLGLGVNGRKKIASGNDKVLDVDNLVVMSCEESETPDKESGKSDKESGKSDKESGKSDLNNYNNSLSKEFDDNVITIDNSNKAKADKTTSDEKKEFGNSEINEVIKRFADITHFTNCGSKADRFRVSNMLKNKSKGRAWIEDKLNILEEGRACGDVYLPKITSLTDLDKKADDLVEWKRKHDLEENSQKERATVYSANQKSVARRVEASGDVEEMFKAYEQVFGFPLAKNERNILGAEKLIQELGLQYAMRLVATWFESLKDNESKYFGVIKDFGDLSEKYQGLIMWSERRYNKKNPDDGFYRNELGGIVI